MQPSTAVKDVQIELEAHSREFMCQSNYVVGEKKYVIILGWLNKTIQTLNDMKSREYVAFITKFNLINIYVHFDWVCYWHFKHIFLPKVCCKTVQYYAIIPWDVYVYSYSTCVMSFTSKWLFHVVVVVFFSFKGKPLL